VRRLRRPDQERFVLHFRTSHERSFCPSLQQTSGLPVARVAPRHKCSRRALPIAKESA
jgi:hypothetical protein